MYGWSSYDGEKRSKLPKHEITPLLVWIRTRDPLMLLFLSVVGDLELTIYYRSHNAGLLWNPWRHRNQDLNRRGLGTTVLCARQRKRPGFNPHELGRASSQRYSFCQPQPTNPLKPAFWVGNLVTLVRLPGHIRSWNLYRSWQPIVIWRLFTADHWQVHREMTSEVAL